ncbi:c6 transcription factor [Neofusicoccum parvum]|nr:c6 transcription factor [Neofusicoccum parvum]
MADRTQPRRRGYRRNYQACEACKKQKGRCDLGSPDNPQPPCTRCRRARKECVFGPSRFTSRGHASDSTSPAAQTSGSSTAAPSGILSLPGVRETADRTWTSARVSPAGGPSSANNNAAVTPVSQPFSSIGTAEAGTVTSQISTQDEGHLRDHLMNATIRNPTEAMTLLSHTMRHTREQPVDPPFSAAHSESRYPPDDIYCRDYELGPTPRSKFRANEYPEAWDDNPRGDEETFSTWMHFRMCKDKLLSPNEALFLINYFFEHMNSLNPILSDYYHDPKNHLEMLREEPTLTCTIICIAASSLDCGLEIAQLAHMATTTLYQSPSQTKNMIVSKKYLGAVSHFDTLFQNWHSKVRSIPSPVPTFTAQADIMYHSIRSYIHLIAVQAIMERSLPTSYQNAKPDQPILYDESNLAEIMNLPETARDLDLIKVVVGLNVEPKSDMITLIKQVVHVIEISAIDDIDLGPIYAETLRTLIAKVENARPARTNPFPSSTGQASAMQQKDHDEATNGYCPRTGATLSPSNDTTTTPSSSSRAMATSVATSGSTAPTPALQSANDPNVATNAPLGSGEDDGGSGFPDVTTAMDTDLGGNPSDWSQWLAFQFDPSFTAFEMGYMVDTTNPFM